MASGFISARLDHQFFVSPLSIDKVTIEASVRPEEFCNSDNRTWFPWKDTEF